MMFLLTFYIVLNSFYMPLGNRESAITILPTELIKNAIMLINPFTAVSLDQSDTITQRHCFGQDVQSVYMVCSTAYTNGRAIIIVENLGNVCMDGAKMLFREALCPPFR